MTCWASLALADLQGVVGLLAAGKKLCVLKNCNRDRVWFRPLTPNANGARPFPIWVYIRSLHALYMCGAFRIHVPSQSEAASCGELPHLEHGMARERDRP